MKLIFCIDEKKGMMFFGKRQSQDSVLREWIIAHTAGSKLWMSSYSAKQFKELEGYIVDDDYVSKAAVGDYCFIENTAIPESFEKIVIYRWNRVYPSDVKFDTSLILSKQLVSSFEFEGSSHSKITEEVYE